VADEVPLREHLLALLEERDKRYSESSAADARAVLSALLAVEKRAETSEKLMLERFSSHNQIRPWVESQIAGAEKDIRTVEGRVARGEDRKAGVSDTAKVVMAAVGCLGAVVGIVGGLLTLAITVYALLHH
jgi:hypothetical protein